MTPIQALASILRKAKGRPCEYGLIDIGEEVVVIRKWLDNRDKKIEELNRAIEERDGKIKVAVREEDPGA